MRKNCKNTWSREKRCVWWKETPRTNKETARERKNDRKKKKKKKKVRWRCRKEKKMNNDKKIYLERTQEVSELFWVCVYIEMLSEYQFFFFVQQDLTFLFLSISLRCYIPRIYVALSVPLIDTLKHHRWIKPKFFVYIRIFFGVFFFVHVSFGLQNLM